VSHTAPVLLVYAVLHLHGLKHFMYIKFLSLRGAKSVLRMLT